MYKGLFFGLSTIDIINYVSYYPSSNDKLRAKKQLAYAGGPATNASIAFAAFSNVTKLVTSIAKNSVSEITLNDIKKHQVKLINVASEKSIPIISAINIDVSNGDRSVVYTDTDRVTIDTAIITSQLLDNIDLVMLDGYYMEGAIALAQLAKKMMIPVVLDGGSWKEGMDELLPLVSYAICSQNFTVPGDDVISYLQNKRIEHLAITRGANPILVRSKAIEDTIDIPQSKVVDTLGAGDIFHGSFCHFLLAGKDFFQALRKASEIASRSCMFYGPREWINKSSV